MRRTFPIFLTLLIIIGSALLPASAQAAATPYAAGAVTTGGGRLMVRSSPSTASTVRTHLNKGSYITLISRSGSWWQVEYGDGQYGWCHADYITPVQGTPVTVNTGWGNLNVRSGPGTYYEKSAVLPKGKSVLLLSSGNGWSRILYHGVKTGYVSAQYLSGAAGSTVTQYSAVSLAVPGYKQTDSRWGHVTLGSSGGTIARIGCATTGIAMMESYRTGTTIYPDAMSRQLQYTAGGSVYWPAHYTTVTQQQGYLEAIHSLLKQGKPVLLGARNAYGGQHWVVITGYSGGTSLTAAGFSIQDPGSNTRSNLQQFLDAYPNFYKYFHY